MAGVSTSELHVHVRRQSTYSQFSHLHSPLAAVHVHVVIAYICNINLCMWNFAWHVWCLNSKYVCTTLSQQFSVCCLVVRDTSVYDKSSKILTHSCNNVPLSNDLWGYCTKSCLVPSVVKFDNKCFCCLHHFLSARELHRPQRSAPTGNNINTSSLPYIEVLRGRDGRDGRDGEPGPRGPQGQRGEQGVAGPPGPRNGGVIYIRWGKTRCPNVTGTELVYAGRAGGS